MYGDSGADRKSQRPALITQMDDAIGEIFGKLRDLGLDDNTLVMFISDNGGDGAANNVPLRGKKAEMFEGGLRVPLVARCPAGFRRPPPAATSPPPRSFSPPCSRRPGPPIRAG